MSRSPFTYVFEAGRGFRQPASSSNPTVRAATLAGATVVFLALILLFIPLVLLFFAFFVVFWLIAKVQTLLGGSSPNARDERRNVRVVGSIDDHSAGS